MRYHGCRDAATPHGWLMSESRAARQLRRSGGGSPRGPPPPSTPPLSPPSAATGPTHMHAVSGPSGGEWPIGSPQVRPAALSDVEEVRSALPSQVQMRIVAAPAEFCVPMKKDRVIKPPFQVQVCLARACGRGEHPHRDLRRCAAAFSSNV